MSLLTRVETEYGTVVGQPTESQRAAVFKGIPYASAPVGDLRWHAPQPPQPWNEPLHAYTYSPIPWQERSKPGTFYHDEFHAYDWPMDEDCLYMDIITPAESTDDKLPVALWIYGGGFATGYSHTVGYGGEAFAKRGVVYVSFNYRINLFGFFSSPDLDGEADGAYSGNYGLLDQVAAAEWIKRNIAAFGGDPDRITVFGQSAGAQSIYNLLCSPLCKDSFAGAIMESGGGPITGTATTSSDEEMRAYCKRFTDWLGCASAEDARAIPADKLFASWVEFGHVDKEGALKLHPIADGHFLPEPANDLFRKGRFANIPTILGTCADEGKGYGMTTTTFRDGFVGGTMAFSIKQTEEGREPVYLYHVTNEPPGEPYAGAYHSSEHFYIFQTFLRSPRPFSGIDFDLSNDWIAYWVNFMETGNPNGDGLVHWDRYLREGDNALIFNRLEPRHMAPMPDYGGEPLRIAHEQLGIAR